MTRFLGYIAASLDGRVADAAGGMDWLEAYNSPDCDYGYKAFYDQVDVLVMGRGTYDFIAEQPEWPYPDKPSIVVTSRPLKNPPPGVSVRKPDFEALRAELLRDDDQTVWIVGGGRTLRGALDAGMCDQLQLFVMPLVLGGGPLLFTDGRQIEAELSRSELWPGGVVELQYQF